MTKTSIELQPTNLASIFRGLYVRVASRVGVDPSYVSRVARGERRSEEVEAVLEQETRRIIGQFSKKSKSNHNGNHNGFRNGSRPRSVNRRGARVAMRASHN